jgi:hypothetical protein
MRDSRVQAELIEALSRREGTREDLITGDLGHAAEQKRRETPQNQ